MPLIDWSAQYEFIGLDVPHASSLISDISVYEKGNILTSHPPYYYTMGKERALVLEVKLSARVHVQSLDTATGVEFISKNWRYTRDEKTLEYVRTMIRRYPSVGVYVDGVLVSGVSEHSELLVGMLVSEPEWRNRGYAVVCTKTQLKQVAREGYVPAPGVEARNEASRKFHEKVGIVVSHETVDVNTIGF